MLVYWLDSVGMPLRRDLPACGHASGVIFTTCQNGFAGFYFAAKAISSSSGIKSKVFSWVASSMTLGATSA